MTLFDLISNIDECDLHLVFRCRNHYSYSDQLPVPGHKLRHTILCAIKVRYSQNCHKVLLVLSEIWLWQLKRTLPFRAFSGLKGDNKQQRTAFNFNISGNDCKYSRSSISLPDPQ